MLRPIQRLFTQTDQVEVRIVVLADGKGVDGAEVTFDGVMQATVGGIVSFYNVTQGVHTYSIAVPPGYSFVKGEDPFKRPLPESGTTTIEWMLIPGTPWPADNPWLMGFTYASINGNGNGDNGKQFSILGLWNWPVVSQLLEKFVPNAPFLTQQPLPTRGTGLILGTARRDRGFGVPLTDVERAKRHPTRYRKV